jgi:NADH dehydrogenase FAD-containing subunit
MSACQYLESRQGWKFQFQPLVVQVAVVGGGAGGVELAMSMHHYLSQAKEGAADSTASVPPAHVT